MEGGLCCSSCLPKDLIDVEARPATASSPPRNSVTDPGSVGRHHSWVSENKKQLSPAEGREKPELLTLLR